MSIKIKPLRKFTTGTPSTSDMVEGELAVNTADKKVFMRDDSNNIVEVGAASSLSLPITGGTLTGNLSLTSTDAGSSADPTLTLFRNSSSPADGDDIGQISFKGNNDASQDVTYANIFTEIADASDGSEDTRLKFQIMSSGAIVTPLEIKFGRIYANSDIYLETGNIIRFEGSTADTHETTLTVADPTTDRTITLPNASGTVALTSQLPSTALDDITTGDAEVTLATTSGQITIDNQHSDSDIVFKGNDGGSTITALTLDMSDEGTALFNHNIVMVDNAYVNIGTGDGGANGDLRIRSNGTHGYVEHLGGGSLILKGDIQSFRNKADDEQLAKFTNGGAVELYYDNVLKHFTKSSGTRTMGSNASQANILTYGPSSAPQVFTVTVASTNQYHPYNGDGSSNKYLIDGEMGAAVELHGADALTSNTEYYYRFDQSDSSNANHPLRFYLTADKTTEYTTGVTTNGTPGQAGAYTQIAVTMSTPKTLYYQCSQHAYMGNYVTVVNSSKFSEGITVSGGSSGDALLVFDTDRSWQFQQSGDDASTRLQLKSNVGSKFFDICSSTGTAFASFYAHDTTPSLTLTSTNAAATEGPLLTLNRSSASPADSDLIGAIEFQGSDSGGSTLNYGKIDVKINDVTNGTEDGEINISSVLDGTLTKYYSAGFGSNIMFKPIFMMAGQGTIFFEGATNNDFETSLTVTDPTADRTITLPDATGTVITTGNSDTPTTTTSSADADFVLIDDGGTMKKITPSNLGIGGGGGGSSFNGTLTSTDAGATAGPILTLDRNSSSPADDDFLGDIHFKGRNDAGEEVTYASFMGRIVDASDGTEDARLIYKVMKNGALSTVLDIKADQLKINNVSEVFFADPVSSLKFEGATGDAFETTLAITDPTADRTVTVPDATGTILTTGNSDVPTTTTSSGDADHVLIDDGGTMKKISPANLGIGGGGGGGGSTAADDITAGDAAVNLTTTSGNITIDAQGSNTDIIFKGTDGTSDITALTLDMSDSGKAIFNAGAQFGGFAGGSFFSVLGQAEFRESGGGILIRANSGQTRAELHFDGSEKLVTNTNGVTVTGLLTATTKSFDIKHPTKEHMRLRYGVLEGPEHGVYIRGKLINSNVIELPEHWTGLVDEDTITVQLTPTGKFQKLYVKEISDNKITIGNGSFFSNNTECFYTIQGTRKDVDELEIEYEN